MRKSAPSTATTPKIEQPPKKSVTLEVRSFAKLIEQRVYMLDGVVTNPIAEDTREAFVQLMNEYMEAGDPDHQAKKKANAMRLSNFGVGPEHGFFGEPVKAWFPGNFAVLLRPLTAEHGLNYYKMHGETLEHAFLRIITVTQNLSQAAKQAYRKQIGEEAADTPSVLYLKDELGGTIVPGLGVMYGPLDNNMLELAAFILSCHGRVVGQTGGRYDTEAVTPEEVIAHMPLDFLAQVQPDRITVFEEITSVSTLWNPELVQNELLDGQDVTEEDLGK